MNCCDEFGNCNQGRDCPLRKEKTPCSFCFGTGYDASGQLCACQPETSDDIYFLVVGCLIAAMFVTLTVKGCLINV
jgi:hypothetical protein